MVNKLFKVLTGVLLTASLMHADGGAFFDLKAGGGTWIANKPSGSIGATEAAALDLPAVFGIEGGFTGYMWAEFQHFIPIIPHFRVEYSKMEFSGVPTASFDFGGTTYTWTGGESAMSMDNADFILFYDIDLFEVDINFGLGGKVILGELTTTLDPNVIVPIPGFALYAYVNLRREILAGFGAEIEYKWFPAGLLDELAFTEFIIKGDYTLDVSFAEVGVEAGIRSMDLTINVPSGPTYLNIGLGGVFFGGFVKF